MRPAPLAPVLLGPVLLALGAGLAGCAVPGTSVAGDAGGPVDPVDSRYPPMADVTVNACSGTSGTWSVSGTVSNPTKQPATYQVSVSVVDASGAVVGSVEASAPSVKPAGSAPWKASVSAVPTSAKACRLTSVSRLAP